jgi:hypothetical protein
VFWIYVGCLPPVFVEVLLSCVCGAVECELRLVASLRRRNPPCSEEADILSQVCSHDQSRFMPHVLYWTSHYRKLKNDVFDAVLFRLRPFVRQVAKVVVCE